MSDPQTQGGIVLYEQDTTFNKWWNGKNYETAPKLHDVIDLWFKEDEDNAVKFYTENGFKVANLSIKTFLIKTFGEANVQVNPQDGGRKRRKSRRKTRRGGKRRLYRVKVVENVENHAVEEKREKPKKRRKKEEEEEPDANLAYIIYSL